MIPISLMMKIWILPRKKITKFKEMFFFINKKFIHHNNHNDENENVYV